MRKYTIELRKMYTGIKYCHTRFSTYLLEIVRINLLRGPATYKQYTCKR